jgi:hypothetical protein
MIACAVKYIPHVSTANFPGANQHHFFFCHLSFSS